MFAPIFAPIAERRRNLIVVAVGLAFFYLVGLDQGHVLSLVQGSAALDQNLIHELLHDARHVAGFPCH